MWAADGRGGRKRWCARISLSSRDGREPVVPACERPDRNRAGRSLQLPRAMTMPPCRVEQRLCVPNGLQMQAESPGIPLTLSSLLKRKREINFEKQIREREPRSSAPRRRLRAALQPFERPTISNKWRSTAIPAEKWLFIPRDKKIIGANPK
jgi:hypothetical protein